MKMSSATPLPKMLKTVSLMSKCSTTTTCTIRSSPKPSKKMARLRRSTKSTPCAREPAPDLYLAKLKTERVIWMSTERALSFSFSLWRSCSASISYASCTLYQPWSSFTRRTRLEVSAAYSISTTSLRGFLLEMLHKFVTVVEHQMANKLRLTSSRVSN